MIKNLTRGNVLCHDVSVRKTLLEKASGLMFSKERDDFGMVFIFRKPQLVSLHMLFVFYPIDVLFLDSEFHVVELKEDFRPFTIYNPKLKSTCVIELPAGTIVRTGTKIGDKLTLR